MTTQNNPRDERHLQRRLTELERRIHALETAPRAGHTSISSGRLSVGAPDADDKIDVDSGSGAITFTRSGQPAGTLQSYSGGGAALEASAATGEILPFATSTSVQSVAIASVIQTSADNPSSGDTTSIGSVDVALTYIGTDHAPQVSVLATSADLPDSALINLSCQGGIILDTSGRTTDPPTPPADCVVLYVKSGRLYYRDPTGTVHGPL